VKDEKIFASWSKIQPDANAHERILENIIEGASSDKKRNAMTIVKSFGKILVPIAACAIFLLVLAVPMLMRDNEAPIVYDPDYIESNEIEKVEHIAPVEETVEREAALTLNQMRVQLLGINLPMGNFFHDVPSEQLQSVLPDLGFPISALAVIYKNPDDDKSSLIYMEVFEMATPRSANDTWIRISPDMNNISLPDDSIISYVLGVPVIANVYNGPDTGMGGGDNSWRWDGSMRDDGLATFTAIFTLNEVAYAIRFRDYAADDIGLNRLADIVYAIIQHGAPDLTYFENHVNEITIDEARQDPDFGRFVPENIPDDFVSGRHIRYSDQRTNGLSIRLNRNFDFTSHIRWEISTPTAHDLTNIVSVNDREKFDMSLYAIPIFDTRPEELERPFLQFSLYHFDTVPEDIRHLFFNPVFRAEELTFEIVQARATRVSVVAGFPFIERNDTYQFFFSVLYDDVLIQINTVGLSPQQVWDMLP